MRYPVVLNGDHAEFELEHANTPPHERSDWPLPSFDARDWAKSFCQNFMVQARDGSITVDDDEALMLTWFANALMRGFDEGRKSAMTTPDMNATASATNSAPALQGSLPSGESDPSVMPDRAEAGTIYMDYRKFYAWAGLNGPRPSNAELAFYLEIELGNREDVDSLEIAVLLEVIEVLKQRPATPPTP